MFGLSLTGIGRTTLVELSHVKSESILAYCSMMDSRTGSGFLRGKSIRHQRELIKRNIFTIVVSGSLNRWYVIYNHPIGSIYHLYTTYILPIG